MASTREATIAFGRQTAKGAPLDAPTFEIPMGGGHASPSRNVEPLPWTNDSQDPIGHFVSYIGGVVALSGLPVLPISSVALFKSVLGALSTSGVAAPYSHEVSPADELDWWTFFYAEPTGDFWKIPDVKISDATLGWAPGQPLSFDLSGEGGVPERLVEKWDAATIAEAVEPFLTYINATMRLEASATPAATQVHNIASGSISINRNTESIQTDGISASERSENQREIAVELPDVVFNDPAFRRTIFTGTANGTAVTSAPVYGSARFTFIGSDQAAAAVRSLEIALPKLLWATEPIEADPSGGTVRYSLAGSASKPAGGATISAIVKNGNAGASY